MKYGKSLNSTFSLIVHGFLVGTININARHNSKFSNSNSIRIPIIIVNPMMYSPDVVIVYVCKFLTYTIFLCA